MIAWWEFQFTRPRRARRQVYRQYSRLPVSIHAPAKGATIRGLKPIGSRRVSIHAPAKGATSARHGASARQGVSIHAPAKGATWISRPTLKGRRSFNSRAREGRDARPARRFRQSRVSIHAPAKGATPDRTCPNQRALVSIHAPAKGATWGSCVVCRYGVFQFTRPRRARHSGLRGVRRGWVSIHAPAKGATVGGWQLLTVSAVSIHAPAKGATGA